MFDPIATRSFVRFADGVDAHFLRLHHPGLTFIVRMHQGARAPVHGHPGGEETYLLEGRLRICDRLDVEGKPQPDIVLSSGDYVFVPPGETHEGIAEEAALFLVVAPGGVARPG